MECGCSNIYIYMGVMNLIEWLNIYTQSTYECSCLFLCMVSKMQTNICLAREIAPAPFCMSLAYSDISFEKHKGEFLKFWDTHFRHSCYFFYIFVEILLSHILNVGILICASTFREMQSEVLRYFIILM